MKAEEALDNPVWYALTGPHANLALGRGRARHYPLDVAPFSGIEHATPPAYADLAADLSPRSEARLFRATNEPAPPGWEALSAHPFVQMVCNGRELPTTGALDDRIVELSPGDVPDMLALVNASKPGPFATKTHQLGIYVGIRDSRDGRLIAMGGERLHVDSHVELSAIAVHPTARGRGFGAAITIHLARAAIARGKTPFLHVFRDNPALGLYRRLGFRERATLWVLWHRPVTFNIKELFGHVRMAPHRCSGTT